MSSEMVGLHLPGGRGTTAGTRGYTFTTAGGAGR
jgi:hypothetical protein